MDKIKDFIKENKKIFFGGIGIVFIILILFVFDKDDKKVVLINDNIVKISLIDEKHNGTYDKVEIIRNPSWEDEELQIMIYNEYGEKIFNETLNSIDKKIY